MKMYDEIKHHFETFGFQWQESVPIVSTNPKLLFNISGGIVFEDTISHGVIPEKTRVVSIQTCLRTDGWEKIGLSGRHHLAFDMLGHFSLYEGKEYEVKDTMIESAWRYLTACVNISPNTLSATVHPQDTTSHKIWEKLGVGTISNDENITFTPTRNRCGVRTEIVWQNPSTGRSMELWNLVFTEFQGEVLFESALERIAGDSGASIDRLITAIEGANSDYTNSEWKSIIEDLQGRARNSEWQKSCRLADLGKATVLLANEGLKPIHGNTAGYVLRKIIRNSYVTCRLLELDFPEFLVLSIERWLSSNKNVEMIRQTVSEEIARFEKTLKRGHSKLISLYQKKKRVSADDIDYLVSCYGYPKDLIENDLPELERREIHE